ASMPHVVTIKCPGPSLLSYIMGFVSKEMERVLLKDREPGTFLLRFSESHLGGITFTWVEHSDNGDVKFNSVEPYTKNRLSALPFADIIRDYKVISNGGVPENPLKFLYPDIPKDEAFGRLYNSQPSKVHPYIPSTLIPISELRSEASSTPRSCPSPEPPMTPGEFDMLSEHLCFDVDTVKGFVVGSLQMAQWQELLKLDSALQNQVRQLYEGRFPTEIRHWLSNWIESQDWGSAAVDENAARTCFQALLEHLQDQWTRSIQENNILQGPNFSGMKDYVMENFQAQPMNLAALLSECLKEEKKILASVTATLQLVTTLNQSAQIVTTLTSVELPKWKRRQQLACIGSPEDTSLELLQKCALVVEKQPVMQNLPHRPLILKTGVRFKVTVSSNQVPSAWASIMWFNMLSTSEPMVRKANFIRANKNNQPLLNQSELKNAWLCPAEPVPVCRSSSALLAAAGASSELAVSVHGPAAT
ncbi:hypothetical protein XENOCAPTIV_021613, partial [Xenoophorus captivus]